MVSYVISQKSDLGDGLEKAFQAFLRAPHFAFGIRPVSLQREGALEAVLKERSDLPDIVELAVADPGPHHLPILMLVVAQVYVEDAREVELAVALGKALLAALARIVGIPHQADVVFLDVLEKQ